MNTFFIWTAGNPGPRGGKAHGHKFIVVAEDEQAARALVALDVFGHTETVVKVEMVLHNTILRIGGF